MIDKFVEHFNTIKIVGHLMFFMGLGIIVSVNLYWITTYVNYGCYSCHPMPDLTIAYIEMIIGLVISAICSIVHVEVPSNKAQL